MILLDCSIPHMVLKVVNKVLLHTLIFNKVRMISVEDFYYVWEGHESIPQLFLVATEHGLNVLMPDTTSQILLPKRFRGNMCYLRNHCNLHHSLEYQVHGQVHLEHQF